MRFVLCLLATLMAVAPAQAGAVYSFSFSNVEGPIAGTVSGSITLSGFGDGTFAATSIIIDSAPASLGYPPGFEVTTGMTIPIANSFNVIGGQIVAGSSSFGAQEDGPPNRAFTLNFMPGTFGSILTPFSADSPLTGVVDKNNSTLTYGAPPAVPEPSTAVGLALFGLIGGGLRRLQRMRRTA